MSPLEKAALSVGAGVLLALVFFVMSLVFERFDGIGWSVAYGFARTGIPVALLMGVMGAINAYSAKSGGGDATE